MSVASLLMFPSPEVQPNRNNKHFPVLQTIAPIAITTNQPSDQNNVNEDRRPPLEYRPAATGSVCVCVRSRKRLVNQ